MQAETKVCVDFWHRPAKQHVTSSYVFADDFKPIEVDVGLAFAPLVASVTPDFSRSFSAL